MFRCALYIICEQSTAIVIHMEFIFGGLLRSPHPKNFSQIFHLGAIKHSNLSHGTCARGNLFLYQDNRG